MQTTKTILGALALLLTLTGCPGFGDKDLEDLVDVPETPPTWDADVQQILADNCIVCHTDPAQNFAPDYFRLDKYTTDDIEDGGLLGAKEMTDKIFARAINNDPGPMPPTGPLNTTLKAILGEWITSGAPRSTPPGSNP